MNQTFFRQIQSNLVWFLYLEVKETWEAQEFWKQKPKVYIEFWLEVVAWMHIVEPGVNVAKERCLKPLEEVRPQLSFKPHCDIFLKPCILIIWDVNGIGKKILCLL